MLCLFCSCLSVSHFKGILFNAFSFDNSSVYIANAEFLLRRCCVLSFLTRDVFFNLSTIHLKSMLSLKTVSLLCSLGKITPFMPIPPQLNSFRTLASKSKSPSPDEALKLPSSTSKFRPKHVQALKIKYENIDRFLPRPKAIIPKDVMLSYLPGSILKLSLTKNVDEFNKLVQHLSPGAKTLAIALVDILESAESIGRRDETVVDAFIMQLLFLLGFSDYPFKMTAHPWYKTMLGKQKISSKFDFSVTQLHDKKIVLVSEDKHMLNDDYGENQIAGELIAALTHKYVQTGKINDWLFGIRVKGTYFTFYKTYPSATYLESLSVRLPTESMTIFQYPPAMKLSKSEQLSSQLDFDNPSDHQHIIELLISIKEHILSS